MPQPNLPSRPLVRLTERGSGKPVVFIHGSPSPSTHFLPIADRLADRYRCILVDLPGYLGVPDDARHSPLDDVNRAVEEALLREGVDEAVLVGLSMGAWRALSIAVSTSRLRVAGVFCMGGFAELAPAHTAGMLALAQSIRALETLDVPDLVSAVAPTFLTDEGLRDPARVEAVRECLRAGHPATVARELEAIAQHSRLDDLERLACPVIVRSGEADRSTPPEYARALVHRLQHAELEVVPGMSHLLPIEDRERTGASLLRALETWF